MVTERKRRDPLRSALGLGAGILAGAVGVRALYNTGAGKRALTELTAGTTDILRGVKFKSYEGLRRAVPSIGATEAAIAQHPHRIRGGLFDELRYIDEIAGGGAGIKGHARNVLATRYGPGVSQGAMQGMKGYKSITVGDILSRATPEYMGPATGLTRRPDFYRFGQQAMVGAEDFRRLRQAHSAGIITDKFVFCH